MGETPDARLERDAGGAKLQILLLSARQFQKLMKKLPGAETEGVEGPVEGLSMKDLCGQHETDKLQKILEFPALTAAVAVQSAAAVDAIKKTLDMIEDITHGAHVEGTASSWKASLTGSSTLNEVLIAASAGLLWINADKMENGRTTLEQAGARAGIRAVCAVLGLAPFIQRGP